MCDSELIAAILEELGYLDEKKEEDNEEEDYEEENIKEDIRKAGQGEQK